MEYFLDLFADATTRTRSSSSSTRPRSRSSPAVPGLVRRASRCSSTCRSRRSAATTATSRPRWSSATSTRPYDWAPDIGHGTIEPFSDVAVADRRTRRRASRRRRQPGHQPHARQPDLAPGEYHAQLVLRDERAARGAGHGRRDPQRGPARRVRWGRAAPSSTRHSGDPIADATVTLHAQWPPGTPLDIVATTDDGGAYSIIGPGRHVADRHHQGRLRARHAGQSRSPPASRRPAPTRRSTRSSRTPRSRATPDPSFLLTPGGKATTTVDPRQPRAATPTCTSPSARSISVGRAAGAGRRAAAADPARRRRPERALDARLRGRRGRDGRPAAPRGRRRRPRQLADAGLTLPWGVALHGRRLARRPVRPDRRRTSRTARRAARSTSRSDGLRRDWGATWPSTRPAA